MIIEITDEQYEIIRSLVSDKIKTLNQWIGYTIDNYGHTTDNQKALVGVSRERIDDLKGLIKKLNRYESKKNDAHFRKRMCKNIQPL